jgi:predicted DNA-binding transcriptional regulator AlpA
MESDMDTTTRIDPDLKLVVVLKLLGGISRTTLWRMVKRNEIAKPIYRHGRAYWRESDIIAVKEREDATRGDATGVRRPKWEHSVTGDVSQ